MLTSSSKKRLLLAAVVSVGLAAPAFTGSASADPKQFGALVGVGSDTTENVVNGFAGYDNGFYYTPVKSVTGDRQLVSWDATAPAGAADNCISLAGGIKVQRPNGSTNGRAALSRAFDGVAVTNAAGGWGTTADCGPTTNNGRQDVSGLIDFARSSGGPSTGDTGTSLTYVPFARDAVGIAYYRAAGSPVTDFTYAELEALYKGTGTTPNVLTKSNGSTNVDIIACGIQLGSGTQKFNLSSLNGASATSVTATQEAAATAACNAAGTGARLQEHDAAGLKAKGDALEATRPGIEVIVFFSAAKFIAKRNGLVPGDPAAYNVDLATISSAFSTANIGKPYSGTGTSVTVNSTYYADSKFSRKVYNVLPTSILTGPGNTDIKEIFIGTTTVTTPILCATAAQATVATLGFASETTCGSQTTKGSFIAGVFNV